MEKNEFPGRPYLKKVTYSSQYGRMELLSVDETSDGYLVGYAKIGTGKHAYGHSVFLGRNPYHKESK